VREMDKYYKEFKEKPFKSFVEFIERQAKQEVFDDLKDIIDLDLQYDRDRVFKILKKKHEVE
jgi:hypothetical protein